MTIVYWYGLKTNIASTGFRLVLLKTRMVHHSTAFVPQTVSLRAAKPNLTDCGTTGILVVTMAVTTTYEPFLFTVVISHFDAAFRSPQVVANLPFGSTAKNAEFSPR